jgi:RNA polymerase-binding transcription factor DksA
MSAQHNKTLEELKARKSELEARIDAIRNDLKSGLDPDSEEQAVQLENYEVLMGLLKNAENELGDINEQLMQLGNQAN